MVFFVLEWTDEAMGPRFVENFIPEEGVTGGRAVSHKRPPCSLLSFQNSFLIRFFFAVQVVAFMSFRFFVVFF